MRLEVTDDELRRRLAGRGRPGEDSRSALACARQLRRRSAPGLDTTGMALAATVRAVSAQAAGWLDPVAEPAHSPGIEPVANTLPGGDLLWICGARAVGKSTVGWQAYEQHSKSGVRTSFADLQQLGLVRPDPPPATGHRLRAGNLAAAWRRFRRSGTHRMVVVGSVETPAAVASYRLALPDVRITLVRLRAGRTQLDDRIHRRSRGEGPQLAGDDLRHQLEKVLRRAVDGAVRESAELDQAAVGDLVIDTDDRSALQLAAALLARIGWDDAIPFGR